MQKIIFRFDFFVSLPTESRKSLCYWSLAGAFDYMKGNRNTSSTVIIVTPLMAVLKDQVSGAGTGGQGGHWWALPIMFTYTCTITL